MTGSHADRPVQPSARRPGIARSAALLAGLTAASQLLGFVRDAVIAAVYGAGAALDAYLAAQGLMNLVLALVAGAMARSVVPPVSRSAAAGDPGRSSRTVATTLTVTTAVLVVGSLGMYAAAEQVVTVLAPGFDPATTALAAELTRVVLVATVFIAGTDLLAAAAQAHGRFGASGVQGVPFNLVMIVAAAGFGARFGVHALALGFVVGSAVRLAVQLPAVRSAGLRVRPRLALRDPDVREVWRLAPPMLLSSAVVNVNVLVDRAVGSSQGEGVISALSFGWRLVTLVDTLLIVTVAAALYPAFSAVAAPEQRATLRELVGRSLGVMLLLLAPAVALLGVAAEPVVTLVFGRGDFDSRAIALTSTAVTWYAVAAAALGVRVIAARACFAVGDSRTPAAVAVVSMAVNVAGDLTLGVAYGIPGLAASTSISLLAGAALLVRELGRRHAAVPVGRLLAATARVAAAAAVGVLLAVLALPGGFSPGDGALTALGRVVVAAGALLVGYLGVLAALRSPELAELVVTVRRRLAR